MKENSWRADDSRGRRQLFGDQRKQSQPLLERLRFGRFLDQLDAVLFGDLGVGADVDDRVGLPFAASLGQFLDHAPRDQRFAKPYFISQQKPPGAAAVAQTAHDLLHSCLLELAEFGHLAAPIVV